MIYYVFTLCKMTHVDGQYLHGRKYSKVVNCSMKRLLNFEIKKTGLHLTTFSSDSIIVKSVSRDNIFETITQRVFTCSKLIIETLEQGVKWRRSGVFIVNFKHISHLALVFLLLTLNM